MKKTALLAACLALSFDLHAGPPPRAFTVMTRNVYPGLSDASGVIAAVFSGDPIAIMTEVEAVWQQVLATDFPLRSSALADEIAAKLPALVGLQEAALWRSQTPSDFSPIPNAHHVEYDFVETLLADLRARGLHYAVVAEVHDIDIELPRLNLDGNGDPSPQDVRWTDRDVLLVRTDPGAELTVLRGGGGRFSTYLDFGGGIAVPRGYVYADVKMRGAAFRVVSLHLEDGDLAVQMAQAEELLAVPGATALPTLFIGDFNSDANGGPTSAAYDFLIASGLGDAWSAAHPGDAGFTCCQDPALSSPISLLDERIDLVLYRGPFRVVSASLTGSETSDRIAGLWPSDHAGLSVTFTLSR
jgi:hypothetical protein